MTENENEIMYTVDHEIRRPGIQRIFEEVMERNPLIDYDEALAKAKERWHELNPTKS